MREYLISVSSVICVSCVQSMLACTVASLLDLQDCGLSVEVFNASHAAGCMSNW